MPVGMLLKQPGRGDHLVLIKRSTDELNSNRQLSRVEARSVSRFAVNGEAVTGNEAAAMTSKRSKSPSIFFCRTVRMRTART